MSEPQRKLRLASTERAPARSQPATCPVTGVSIPECSCGRCIEEQIRHHSPSLLDQRFRGPAGPRRLP